MIMYGIRYWNKLGNSLIEHIELVLITLIISLFIAVLLSTICVFSEIVSRLLISLFSILYSIPSLAFFAILIPVTGLGEKTAIIVLVVYNQYLLLRNFMDGLNAVDHSIIEAATGMGMTKMQIVTLVRIPLSKRALFTGIRLAVVSTIGIATIAASINAGGLGTILFDGLRTMNVNKIVWGSVLSAGLAIGVNAVLARIERIL